MPQLPGRGEPHRSKKEWQIKYRGFLISFLNKFPLLKKPLTHIYVFITISRYKRISKKIMQKYRNEYDVDKIYWVSPKSIVYGSLKEFDVCKYKGEVIDGDWDLLEKRFEDSIQFIAYKERFINGKDWKDTEYYQLILNWIDNREYPSGYSNKSQFDKQCEFYESLYQDIKNNGYKTQRQILGTKNYHNIMQIEDEIAVNIGRDGDLLFNNGAHRLTLVKLLELKKIPVKITVRHPQWVRFRQQLLLYAKEHDGKIYHPTTHIDLQDIPTFHGTERFDIINKNLSISHGRLLDIGAHWGYFCHKFEEIGFDCYAIENDMRNVYFLKKLKRAGNKNFKIITNSIFEYSDIKNIHFDIVLALNIFHHFLKEKDSYFKLIELLKNLKMTEMYFEQHSPNEFKNTKFYKNFSEEEFVEFILKNSKLSNSKLIGKAQDGRKIYKLY